MVEYANQEFKAGDYILKEYDEPTCAYVLKTGSVDVVKKRSDGSEFVLETLNPGDIFGEMSLVDLKPRSASIRAKKDGELIIVDAPTFAQKQDGLDVFTRKLIKTLIKRLRKQNQRIMDMTEPSALAKAAKKGQIEVSTDVHTNVLIREDYREKLDFGTIKLLMGDTNPQSRQGIKGGLHMQGFREIEDASSINDFRNHVANNDYDLIIVDSSLDVAQISKVIRDIRHGKMATSPFVIIFGVIEQPDPHTLEKLADAGLDDVLVKPVALGNIIDRVERRIKMRKPFVVTLDYVGPDRRSSARPGTEEIPLVTVPNPLTYKALAALDEQQYNKDILRAEGQIETLKIERHAVQMDWLKNKISSVVKEENDPSFFFKTLNGVTSALIKKLHADENDEHVSICQRVLSGIEEFQSGMANLHSSEWDDFSALIKRIRVELGPS